MISWWGSLESMIDYGIGEAMAELVMGWTRENLNHDKHVDDDGCMWQGKCSSCGMGYEKLHKLNCNHLVSMQVWRMSEESWDPPGDPKAYRYVLSWNPLKKIGDAKLVLDRLTEDYPVTMNSLDGDSWDVKLLDEHGEVLYCSGRHPDLEIAICAVAIFAALGLSPDDGGML